MIVRLRQAEWDLTTCERLAELLAPAFDQPDVVVDMTDVEYIDSTCLQKLVDMHRERVDVRSFAPARLAIPSPNVRKLLSVVKLDQLWPIFETLPEACDAPGVLT